VVLDKYSSRALLYRIEVEQGNKEDALKSLKSYISKYEGEDFKDNYYLVLRYFTNEVTLEELENKPDWENLKVAVVY
jgi:hypothetical protein